jgi:hypothetical protein
VQQRWALPGFLTGRGQLEELRAQFFRAGHAHAGVLLVLSLVYFLYLDRTEYSTAVPVACGPAPCSGVDHCSRRCPRKKKAAVKGAI